MFGKRQTPVRKPTLETVIVARSAVEQASEPGKGHVLVAAVVDFVNAMMREGQYHRFEIPAKAVEAYHCDYYLAQVLNGGHFQFIHNCGQNLKYAVTDIPGALAGMKGEAYLAIFKEMAGLLEKFPYMPGKWQAPAEEREA